MTTKRRRRLHLVEDELDALTRVSAGAERVYHRLKLHRNRKTGEAYPSYRLLTALMGYSTRTLTRLVDELEAEGVITRRQRLGKTPIYRFPLDETPDKNVHSTPDTSVHSPGQDCPPPPDASVYRPLTDLSSRTTGLNSPSNNDYSTGEPERGEKDGREDLRALIHASNAYLKAADAEELIAEFGAERVLKALGVAVPEAAKGNVRSFPSYLRAVVKRTAMETDEQRAARIENKRKTAARVRAAIEADEAKFR